jgi:hypothetical protein
MSTYFSAITILLLVLSPLLVPVVITIAPVVFSGTRRITRAVGIQRLAPRVA